MRKFLQDVIVAMRKVDRWLVGSNRYLVALTFFVLTYVSQISWYSVVAGFYGVGQAMGGANFDGRSPLEIAILGCLIAPAIETLLLQYAPIRLCQMTKRVGALGAILISAVLFGVSHGYSADYMAAMFGVGIVFAYAFIIFDRRRERAGIFVFTLHAARNVVSFVIWCCAAAR